MFKKSASVKSVVADEPSRVRSSVTYSNPVWVLVSGRWINSRVIESYLQHVEFGQLCPRSGCSFFDKTFKPIHSSSNGCIAFSPNNDNMNTLIKLAAMVGKSSVRNYALEGIILKAWEDRTALANQGYWFNW